LADTVAIDRVLTFDAPQATTGSYRPELTVGNFVITTSSLKDGTSEALYSSVYVQSAYNSGYPDDGGNYLRDLPADGSLIFRHRDGLTFDARQVDLSEYSTVFTASKAIRFTGTRGDGSTVMQTFVSDGVIDGTGPLADFQTFTFSSDFHDLVELRASNSPFMVDNLALTIHGTELAAPVALKPPILYRADWNGPGNTVGARTPVGGDFAPSTINFGSAIVRSAVGALTDQPLELSGVGSESVIYPYGQIQFNLAKALPVYQLTFDLCQVDSDLLAVFLDTNNGFVRIDFGPVISLLLTPSSAGSISRPGYERSVANHVSVTFDLTVGRFLVFLNGGSIGGGTIPTGASDLRDVRFSTVDTNYDGGTAIDNVVLTGLNASVPGVIAGPLRNPANQHLYYLLAASSWKAARSAALGLCGDLAVVNDATEDTWIGANFGSYGATFHRLWMGMTDLDGDYRWVTGDASSYRNWGSGQPVLPAADAHYVRISSPGDPLPSRWENVIDTAPATSGIVEVVEGGTSTPTPTPEQTPSPTPTTTPRPPDPPRATPVPNVDRERPKVTVSGGGKRQTRQPFVILNGTASDNRKVKEIEIQVGKGAFVEVSVRGNRWYQLCDLEPGRNVFRVRATDSSGNVSRVRQVVVTYQP
jgi:hypothetical protein